MSSSRITASKTIGIAFILILWILTAWLLYPLIKLDSVDMENAKEYLYRSAFGIVIMLIFFGKTLFDLLFPQSISKRVPLMNTIFLTLYSIVLTVGIIYIAARMIVLYLKSTDINSGFSF